MPRVALAKAGTLSAPIDRAVGEPGSEVAVPVPTARRMRPSYERVIPVPAHRAITRIEAALAEPSAPCQGQVLAPHVELLIREKNRHFWSPWLSADILSHPQGAIIEGRFGPHPHVWTMFMFLYALFGFVGFSGLMVGYSQWTIEQYAWGFWLLPLACLLGGGVYALALVGQRLGAAEMALLRDFVEDTVGRADAPE